MADHLAITIDVDQLRRNFSAAEGRECTADDAMEWLRECGFRYQGRTWLCEEVSLRALAKSEYRIVSRPESGTTVLWTVVAFVCLIASVPLLSVGPPVGLALAISLRDSRSGAPRLTGRRDACADSAGLSLLRAWRCRAFRSRAGVPTQAGD